MIKAELKYKEVAELLVRRGISLRELADEIGVSRGHCSMLFQGQRSPSPRVRRKLMEVLGEDFDTLFTIVNNASS